MLLSVGITAIALISMLACITFRKAPEATVAADSELLQKLSFKKPRESITEKLIEKKIAEEVKDQNVQAEF